MKILFVKKKWDKIHIDKMINMQKHGIKTKYIANFFNVTSNAIYKVMNRYIFNYKSKYQYKEPNFIQVNQIKQKYKEFLNTNKKRLNQKNELYQLID